MRNPSGAIARGRGHSTPLDGRTRPRRKEALGRELVTWFERMSSMQLAGPGRAELLPAMEIGRGGHSGTEYACLHVGVHF